MNLAGSICRGARAAALWLLAAVGTCAAAQKCDTTTNRCVSCTPDPLATTCNGKTCGSATNNCGQTVNCGACGAGSSCLSNKCVQCNKPACGSIPCEVGCVTDACGVQTCTCRDCSAG